LSHPEQERYPVIRKMLPFTSAALIIAVLYVGWVFFSRWQEVRAARENAQKQQVEEARRTVAAYGDGRVKIMNFTISPGLVEPGEKAQICYGVSNAKSVTIEPKPDEKVWPSIARCVEASPQHTTTYTLTATDGAGTHGTTSTHSSGAVVCPNLNSTSHERAGAQFA
jgi:hypothetical protein